MPLQISAIGGYNEVGKNMTAVKAGNDAVILDMGLHLDSYIRYTDDEDIGRNISASDLLSVGAVPDDRPISGWTKNVRAIIPTHAHLDHVGALIFISNKYRAPILCTPFTAEVINMIVRDEKVLLKNPIKVLNANSVYKICEGITLEFVNITHSVPQTVMAALHTKEGTVVYANDFKFDNNPIIGRKPNYEKIASLGKNGVKALICDGTRAGFSMKTPSEMVAKEMLRDVLLGTESKGKGIILTTFSSHLARLKSIVEFGRKLDRKIVFLGRSLSKYVTAGENIGLVNFSREVEIVKYGKKIERKLRQIEKQGKENYLLVVTGHQGEPKAALSKIVFGKIKYRLDPEDHVIFSCTVIPSPVNIENRERLESSLKKQNVRIFKDIHVSGHASREDLRDMINLLKPKHIIPAHGDDSMKEALVDLAVEKGYIRGETVHMIHNGEFLSI